VTGYPTHWSLYQCGRLGGGELGTEVRLRPWVWQHGVSDRDLGRVKLEG
jgi:hypothetical protein